MHSKNESQLRPELLSAAALNSWVENDTASRVQMSGSHFSQTLVIEGAEPRRTLTGIEREFGKGVFKLEMPVNAEIERVIEKYPATMDIDPIRENPLTLIVYRNTETYATFDILEVQNFHCLHQNFGFKYKKLPTLSQIHKGATIRKGTILADSPAVDNLGNYCMGLNVNTAMMSDPAIIEDGVVISESLAQRLATKGYQSRSASWGSHYYPVNLYGDSERYKPFPDIGERVKPHGLLMALRRLSDPSDYLLAPVEMTPEALSNVDYLFDEAIWGIPDAKIVDVSVLHGIQNNTPPTPVGMEVQAAKYYKAAYKFYQNLIDLESDLRKRYGHQLVISERFHALLVEARVYTASSDKMKLNQIYRRQPLDDWRVEITMEHLIVPKDGAKLTDFHGG